MLALAKGDEPEEMDSGTSWTGNLDGDDDMDEVKGKAVGCRRWQPSWKRGNKSC